MTCCTGLLLAPLAFVNMTVTEPECANSCFHDPERCFGYTFADECRVCHTGTETCSLGKEPLVTRPTCHGNVCIAVYGDEVIVRHGTIIYLSSIREKYEQMTPEAAFDESDSSVILRLNVSEPRGLTINGPGRVSTDLPLLLGKDVTVKYDVEFQRCTQAKRARAALVLHNGGKVILEGRVQSHHAKAFVTIAPKRATGELVTLEDDSSVTFTGSDKRVCAAAFSHVRGKISINCNSDCFTVSQDLGGGVEKLELDENHTITSNVNLTSLLNDFGTEYLIQYVDGPDNGNSTPTAVAGILSSLTLTLLILTIIFQQRYFKFL